MEMIPAESSNGQLLQYTRKQVFVIIKKHLKNRLIIAKEHLEKTISGHIGRSVHVHEGRGFFLRLFYRMRIMWEEVNGTEEIFFKKYEGWLNAPVYFSVSAQVTFQETPTNKDDCPPTESVSYNESAKRRKTEEIHATSTSTELTTHATQMSSARELDASKVVKETLTSPLTALQCQNIFQSTKESTLSEDAALSVLIEYKLSKSQYQGLRLVSMENHCKLYPPYKQVIQAKNHCYPSTAVNITENSAELHLQALLDHTVERILLLQNDVIRSLSQKDVNNIDFICKWNCNIYILRNVPLEYKQTFINDSKSYANMLFTSVVPLQLMSVDRESKAKIIVWKNPKPLSHRFYRPLRLQLLYEDTESIVEINEIKYVKEQIKLLGPFKTVIDGKEISIVYNKPFTMIRTKGSVTFTSTEVAQQHCYLCGGTRQDFNEIDATLQKNIDETNIKFELSILHAWAFFFTCCLDLSYKLGIKKMQTCSAEEKQMMENRKRIIQKGFHLKLGLTIDCSTPKYKSMESTNDKNTARRFFENSAVSALITGLDECLIKRFHVILQVISCDHEINCDKFKEYAIKTAKKFVELYPWYPMPLSMHKLLIHGPQIIAHALLPIGEFEDPQEARNKDIKKYCEHFSRKCSRNKTIEHVFNRLMVISDPYISSIRKLSQKNLKSLSQEALELLLSPTVATGIESDSMIDTDLEIDSDSNV